jgi:hypothetical protein
MADPIDINALADQTLEDGGYVFMVHKVGGNVTASLLPSTVLQVVAEQAAAALKLEDVGDAAFLNVEDLPAGGVPSEDLETANTRILLLEQQVQLLLDLMSTSQIPIYEDDIYLEEDQIYV